MNAVPHARTVLAATDQAGFLQNPEVFRDSGLGERQFVNDLAANPGLLSGK